MLIILTGPSASGKTTIAQALHEFGIVELRSHTTRVQRENESNSAYYFVSEDEFMETPMVESVTYDGNMYGLSEEEVRMTDDERSDFVVVVEMHGVIQLLKNIKCTSRIVFMDAPDADLLSRLESRGGKAVDRFKLVDGERKLARLCDGIVLNPNGLLENSIKTVLKIAGKKTLVMGD